MRQSHQPNIAFEPPVSPQFRRASGAVGDSAPAAHAYYAHKDGEIREELWKGIESGLTGSFASNKGFRKFWGQKGSIYPEPFHGFVESKLAHEP